MQRLKELALTRSREKYPNFPEHARVIHKYTDKTANGLTRCVIDFLNFSGHQAERISTTGRVIDNRKTYENVIGQRVTIGSTQYIPGTGTKGSADISATVKGRSVKIEVKIGKDKLSDHQKKYAENIKNAGGVYIVVKCFDDLTTWYDEFINT